MRTLYSTYLAGTNWWKVDLCESLASGTQTNTYTSPPHYKVNIDTTLFAHAREWQINPIKIWTNLVLRAVSMFYRHSPVLVTCVVFFRRGGGIYRFTQKLNWHRDRAYVRSLTCNYFRNLRQQIDSKLNISEGNEKYETSISRDHVVSTRWKILSFIQPVIFMVSAQLYSFEAPHSSGC